MNAIKVLYPFWGTTIGGSHIATLLLAENLPDHYRPVFVLHERGALADHLEERGHNYFVLKLWPIKNARNSRIALLLQILLSLPRLLRFLKVHSIQIVHANDGRMNVTWLLPARARQSFFVWHQHSKYRRSRFVDFFATRADSFVAVSRFCAEDIPPSLAARTNVVANPFASSTVNREQARNALRKRIAAPDGAIVLGFFGNTEQRKRPGIFVSVVAELRKRHSETPIIACLFGELREPVASKLVQQIDHLELNGEVHLMGFLYPPEEYLAGCDVLIACAVDEPFGRTLVEALIVGVPVVAANSGGHKEILQDGATGTLVSPDNVSEFADAVDRELGRASGTERIDRAREDVRQRYSVERHVGSIVGIYRRAVGLSATVKS